MHNSPIPPGYLRVVIDYAMEEKTPLPIPLGSIADVIQDAIGTIVLWPVELIVLDEVVYILVYTIRISDVQKLTYS